MAFLKSETHNYKDILITEIALDGLQGIGLNLLWKRVEKRFNAPVTTKLKSRFWDFIKKYHSITFYLQKEPLEEIEILDRFSIVSDETGHLLDPPDYVDGPYEYCPVADQFGSCINFDKRKSLSNGDLAEMSYEEVETKYGDKLVMVASLEERWRALAPHLPMTYLTMLSPVHYCILELIGRARENGQTTIGKTNLTKIIGESKLLFYNRKHLLKLNLIKVLFVTQMVGGKSMKTLLLRLNKFYKPLLLSLPKSGMIHKLVNHLLDQPEFCERTEVAIKKGLLTPKHRKKLQKTSNIFSFKEKSIDTSTKKEENYVIKRKFICLNINSDDDESDNEEQTPPLKCRYKVGVQLIRQAYERFLDAGQNGLTQIQLSELLGVKFYTSRSICRLFKMRKIIREFLEDRGRQRTARYIAVTAQKDADEKYENERKKFLKHLNDSKDAIKSAKKRSADESEASDSKSEVPKKKAKRNAEDNTESAIVEEKCLIGLEDVQGSIINAKKELTLKQLVFANGMLKIIKDRKFVIGFQTLGNLVAKETGQAPMDTKAIKVFIQKLVMDKQLKILKIKWPGSDNKCSHLICAAHVKATDPVIKAKYKEICSKAEKVEKTKAVRSIEPLSKLTYPKYIKILKLHELLTRVVLFDEVKNESLPPGFSTLFSILPEMTVEYAIGNITSLSKADQAKLKVNKDTLGMKLKDAPKDVTKFLLQSKNLQNSIRTGLKMLAVMGLVQIIEKPSPTLAKDDTVLFYVFYVNRCAKILDTSGDWPRCEDMRALEKTFHFESLADVQNYWDEVRTISLNTVVSVTERKRLRMEFPARSDHEVRQHDDGTRHGDGCGPCGFDSSVFTDMPRLWTTYMTTCVLRPPKGPNRRKRSAPRRKGPKKIKAPEINFRRVKLEAGEAPAPRARRKEISWSYLEDKILTMCKAALKIISPTQQAGSLTLKNLVVKDLISIIDPDKNVAAAHRRSVQLESNPMWKHWRDRVVCELRRRSVVREYDGLLKVAKRDNPGHMPRLVYEAKLPMLELVWMILQMEKNKTIRDEYECVARDLDDFNRRYTIALTPQSRGVSAYRTPPAEELQFGMLKELIMTAVLLSYENVMSKEVAHKVYLLFKSYPESVLRAAIEQLRKGGAIVPREKSFVNKETPNTMSQSAFKVSANYRRKWIGRLSMEFFKELATLLNSQIPTVGLRGLSELNCILCELQTCDAVEIFSDSVPVVTGSAGSLILEEQMNVIDVETKYKLKSGHVGWKNKRNVKFLSELYKIIDLEVIFKTMSSNSIVTITNYEYDRNDEILSYLDGVGFKGCTFKELQDHLSIDYELLVEKLTELSSKGHIKAVGYFQNIIMLSKYTKPFLQKIGPDTYLEPTLWVNLDGEIQKEVFFKWATVILNKIFECPGINISSISDNLECVTSRSVLNMCMFLEKCECAIIKTVHPKEVDLFSEDDDVLIDEKDFNPFCPFENICVFSIKNCLTKFSLILSHALNKSNQ